MKKTNKTKDMRNKEKRYIYIYILAVALALSFLIVIFVNIPLYPNNTHITSTSIELIWLGSADRAFVDDNPKFTSPIEIKKGETIELEPGTYYWKTSTGIVSEFTIDSEVSVAREENKIKNTGNIKILAEFFENLGLTGRAVLDVNQTAETNATKIVASQE